MATKQQWPQSSKAEFHLDQKEEEGRQFLGGGGTLGRTMGFCGSGSTASGSGVCLFGAA